ncbi:hypothetical protein AN964_03480 [Heyndrickxia shackletonii]|uniref:Uncharacterized protein n=1 Tax=Heyndrickxia shackletonii TaxID=157838 RepID=A0A0Q3WW01_9BACI|nr:hypothetical protein [Heyndrickxia shackletonii]KQL52677.1 hypothetical protein AN964_03480 [Heyndrickxia shackletonii]NEZ01704.1 hypothetical protein [Heyndrickxia shackletonii]
MVKKKKGNTSKLLLLSTASVVSVVATVNPAHNQAASLSPSQLVQKAEGLAKSLRLDISYQHRIKQRKQHLIILTWHSLFKKKTL